MIRFDATAAFVPSATRIGANWSAQDLADAVPRRLSELLRFDVAIAAAPASAARRPARRSYAPRAVPAALFRVQG